MEHGAIDMIVHRNEMRDTIARLLSKLSHVPLIQETPPSDAEEVEVPVEPEGDE